MQAQGVARNVVSTPDHDQDEYGLGSTSTDCVLFSIQCYQTSPRYLCAQVFS